MTLSRGGQSEQFSIAALSTEEAGPILKRHLELEPVTRHHLDVPA